MFSPWIVAFAWLKKRMPTKWSAFKPRFNFITLHYTYVITMTLIGSVVMYGRRNLDYIDALFFASGAATQSGLNTLDINTLHLYQQIVLMLFATVCTPIFINTFVVFIRLYWFEKRFQNVVLEARSMRRSRTRSRTKSEAKADLGRDLGHEEFGVGDREIRVLIKDEEQNGKTANGNAVKQDSDDDSKGKTASRGQSDGAAMEDHNEELSPTTQPKQPFHRDILFADEVVKSPEEQDEQERLPERNNEKSIAFVENQRNPKDKGTLRIPGPRDFDRGFVPEVIEDGDDLSREPTNLSDDKQYRHRRSNSVPPTELSEVDEREPPLKPHITIDVPERRRPTTGPSAYNRAKSTDAVETSTPSTATPTANMHLRNRSRTRSLGTFLSRTKEEEADPMPYLSWTPTLGRNSNFVDLSEDQREELGGIEYRALKLLAIILVCYYVGFHLLGMICLLPWIVRDGHYSGVVEAVGISPVWWGFFTPASIFNDLGFTLTPDSMISFQFAVLPLLLGTFLIIIGNTGFPCMLRFVIWLCSKLVPHGSGVWEELRFLLDHPRRCFTLLFPSKANWWLFWVLILLNGIDLIFFVILDINDETVTRLPPGFRFLDGLFQAAATRTAGFAVVNIADLHPAIQVSYLVMMYISIFPIAMSMRQTNVYEEKSLGVWADNDDETNSNYLSHHLRRQLSFDLWFVFLGFFLIAIVEGSRLENTNDYAFTLFSVLFEIVSAYGTVGLSLGYPGVNTSFSGQFRTLSKLIIIAMQIRGRHRGLPYALDRAILLPSESLHQKENEDATRRARRNSTVAERPEGLMRTGSGLSRSGSVMTSGSGAPSGYRERFQPKKVRRFFAGALHAGPSIPREKLN